MKNALSPFQQRLAHYLTEPGHSERQAAFGDLLRQNVFSPAITDEQIVSVLTKYVKDNTRGFCADGIERLRRAFPEIGGATTRRVIRVVLDMAVQGPASTFTSMNYPTKVRLARKWRDAAQKTALDDGLKTSDAYFSGLVLLPEGERMFDGSYNLDDILGLDGQGRLTSTKEKQ